MPRLTREATVRATPERVFAALSDPKERAEWLKSMRETPIEGPMRVGSKIPARRTDPMSRSTYELTVAALDAPRRIETRVLRNGSPAGKGGYDLTPAGDGTRVVAFAEYELTGMQRLMGPMVAAGLTKELDEDLASLKRHVERA